MNFGPQTSQDDSHTIMDRAHEHGLNFFDTANVYGVVPGDGVTEQIIGRWFAKWAFDPGNSVQSGAPFTMTSRGRLR
ncbi:aldo/keto reductase [Nonomuraea diastatica]|uniref:aldo/keto reductase n=1 Tax=Nonomuraea diastatica TaxID=1848329 RepID=UPI001C704A5E|nr:aldo/keto reductase [Nonomuraea diastatica]